MDNKSAVAEKLLQINAIKLSVAEPFTWASGWKSPIYCDNRKILSFPYIRDFIKSEMSDLILKLYRDAELIAGVATAGIPWGALVADQLKLPFIYVRPKPKEHGLGNQVEGFYEPEKKVVLVEDLISTGKSSLQAAVALQNAGLQLAGLVSIFNYGFEQARISFDKMPLKSASLTDYESLISKAIEKNIISASEQNTLLNWRMDPANWNVKP
ncbi:MAG: orotate phosphoribosyltransferase [Bacteroidota bacterium]|nr:orotate phosphoribosyltransferase [Bacteroidota bacterium]MDQ6890458.1 orotate phosphoribosyltransferase [Bacteroidota bacterium]